MMSSAKARTLLLAIILSILVVVPLLGVGLVWANPWLSWLGASSQRLKPHSEATFRAVSKF